MSRSPASSFACLLVFLSGCLQSDSEVSPYVARIDELSEGAAIASAPTQVAVQSRTFRLESYLWRDFMPPIGPDGSPLMAVVRIVAADGEPLPKGLDADLLYVVKGEEVWVTGFSSESRPPGEPGVLEKVARGGPEWGPDIAVDVTVRLTDEGAPAGYLRAADQPIHATY